MTCSKCLQPIRLQAGDINIAGVCLRCIVALVKEDPDRDWISVNAELVQLRKEVVTLRAANMRLCARRNHAESVIRQMTRSAMTTAALAKRFDDYKEKIYKEKHEEEKDND